MTQAMFDSFLFGGDWNPEQWDESVWERDIEMLKAAHINEVTINVFSWTLLQPDEHTYDFSTLDRIVALLVSHDMRIVLATATAALPAWLVRTHPDVIRTDENGRRHVFGGRHNFCPNSPVFRRLSGALAGKLAQRYVGTPGLVVWHIGNEYGGGGGMCYCDTCAREFRLWLRQKYGSLDALNSAWCANFWSHTIVHWDDIVPPVTYGDGIGTQKCVISGLLMDYRRFQNDSQLACFMNEKEAIRKYDPATPVTTNLMGTFKDLDYFEWGKHMDIVSWDNYPGMDTPPSYTAMCHDLMRGVGRGKPFMLMEQTPNQQNWFPFCSVKKPGEVRALSWQAIAHGADTVQFFQMRQSIGGCERFHGAVIGHDGSQNSRVYQEIQALGSELAAQAAPLMGTVHRSRVAVVFDWQSYWSLEGCVGPTAGLSYPREVHRFYRTLHERNISVDIISASASLDDLRAYDMVVAPAMISISKCFAQALETYVREGGTLVTGYMSAMHDEHDLIIPGGYPGPLRSVCGVWVEEIDGLAPDTGIQVEFEASGKTARGEIVASIMHLEGAQSVARYGGEGFYAGTPAVTRHTYANGCAYYVGVPMDDAGMSEFMGVVLDDQGLDVPSLAPSGVEVSHRYTADGSSYTIEINLTDKRIEAAASTGTSEFVSYEPFEVRVRKE